jgi:hypothetical protein
MIDISDLFKLNRFHKPSRYRLFSMGMCTICGGSTYYDEDLGVMICESCGADA